MRTSDWIVPLRRNYQTCAMALVFLFIATSTIQSYRHLYHPTRLEQRPIMHTFHEHLSSLTPSDNLDAWRSSWNAAGWDTVILTARDAQLHPQFPRLERLLSVVEISEYNERCFHRWLAMAHAGGGWMSDTDVLPLNTPPQIPNGGRFTLQTGHVPCLLSGTKSEWERVFGLMLDSWDAHQLGYTDMMLLRTVLRAAEEGRDPPYFSADVGHVINGHAHVAPAYFSADLGLVDCKKYPPGLLAVHFSHASVERAFWGGWLERQIREDYPDAKVTFEYRKNDKPLDVLAVTVSIDDKDRGRVVDMFHSVYRGRAALNFMNEIDHQCR